MSVAPALNAAASPKNRKLLFEPSNLTDLLTYEKLFGLTIHMKF